MKWNLAFEKELNTSMLDHCCQSKNPTKVTSKKQSYLKNKQEKWRKWKKWNINKINFFSKKI